VRRPDNFNWIDALQVLPGAGYPPVGQPAVDWTNDYHVIGVEWNATAMSFYVDGNLYETKTASEVNLPTVAQYIIFDTAIAWYWPPSSSSLYPTTHIVDWVRVYTQSSLPMELS
jgi:beta-glucanase (GH16 family)